MILDLRYFISNQIFHLIIREIILFVGLINLEIKFYCNCAFPLEKIKTQNTISYLVLINGQK